MSELLTPLLTSINHDAELENPDDQHNKEYNELQQQPMDYVEKQHQTKKTQQQKKV